jgi:drug/metabolite transporter (DMT)-like permease
MAKILVILLIALVVEAVGVVFLSKGIKQIGSVDTIRFSEIARVVRQGAANGNVLFGVALEAAFFASLLYLLSQRDVTLIWPLTALGFVITALTAKLVLHEQVSPLRWAGVTLIVAGAMLVTWSEKAKEPSTPASAASSLNHRP